jgi:hypothetical protein
MPHPLLPPLPSSSSSSSAPTHFFIPSTVEPELFHPHSALGIAAVVTAQSAGVGLLVSAVQNALDQCVLTGSFGTPGLGMISVVPARAGAREGKNR